jgi:hypothetical protein
LLHAFIDVGATRPVWLTSAKTSPSKNADALVEASFESRAIASGKIVGTLFPFFGEEGATILVHRQASQNVGQSAKSDRRKRFH